MNKMTNDEVNREVATIMFKAVKLTGKALADAMGEFMNNEKAKRLNAKNGINGPSGKMTFEELMKQKQGAVNIEIPKDGVGDFVKIAKKYHIDFAIKKDKSTVPPTYMCFFKARDQDVMQEAFKEFMRMQQKKRDRPSFKEIIESIKKQLEEQRKNRSQNKSKNQNKKREKKRERSR